MALTGAGQVNSDVALLRQVLVHTPGDEIYRVLSVAPEDHSALPGDLIDAEAARQHKGFIEILQGEGVGTVFLEDLLDEAIAGVRAAGLFGPWLQATFPTAYPDLVSRQDEISGSALIGAEDRFFYHTNGDGAFRPLIDPAKAIFYTRDCAIVTPRGVAISNFRNRARAIESSLARFVFHWAASLRKHRIVFDAASEQVYLQGGDVIVADDKTLFVGTGSLTQELAAIKLARKLEMDVLAVQLPSTGISERDGAGVRWSGLHSLFLHLDSICSLVDTHKALVVPYFLEADWSSRDPLTRVLAGLSKAPGVREAHIEHVVSSLKDVGWVTLFKAGSGERDPAVEGLKLVDYLGARGYKILYVGGEQGAAGDFKHIIERVLREIRFQAANVLAVRPGRVIAHEANSFTLDTLARAGVEVVTFPAAELVRWNGGPHCMTMPLERASSAP